MDATVIFDLDGTLAELGRPCTPENVALLHRLEERGARLVLSSGKPVYYLCGFVRQLGLCDPILIGENGGVLQAGVALPPPVFRKASLPEKTREGLRLLKAKMDEEFPDRFWYQPNETALTPFLYHTEDFPRLREMLKRTITPEMELAVYEHSDCFDIAYAALSKGYGIRHLAEVTGLDPKDMISVGDWTNDYSMFRETGYSVGIHLPDPTQATVNFPDLNTALKHILERIEEK
ncbi:MAG: HAD family phosphatase [Clostridia bacterium]|nr:HAD family phosphatase [Clostridia bacterium]